MVRIGYSMWCCNGVSCGPGALLAVSDTLCVIHDRLTAAVLAADSQTQRVAHPHTYP